MSTPSDGPVPDAAGAEERRLHPLSWLFVLLQQLRSFALPLLVVVVTGRGGPAIWLPLVGVAGLALTSVIQYFSYRYRSEASGFVIRSGVLQRTRRDIPYERIHTVNLHQTLLHRLFDVVEVRLESAGSKQAEAVMRVLSMADARALERMVRERGGSASALATSPAGTAPADADVPLLTLGTKELVRLGLISNRGMVVVAAIAGGLWQFADDLQLSTDRLPPVVMTILDDTRTWAVAHLHDLAGIFLIGVVLVIPALVLVRVLSVLLALLQYHGFSLVDTEHQLRIERGLLTRIRNQVPKRRIQAWRLDETVVHRWFNRQTLRIDSAAGGEGDEHQVRYLAPVAPPDTQRALLERLLPAGVWPPREWRPVDPRAWRRLFTVPAVVVTMAAAAIAWFEGPGGLVPLVLLPMLFVRARATARFAAYAATDRTIAVRSGWLNRSWDLAEVRKLQALRLSQSPFDRRMGMATLWFDTAGASSSEGVLRIRFLPVDEARTLFDRIAGILDEKMGRQSGETTSRENGEATEQ